MTGLLAAPFTAAAILLLVAGIPKLRDPMPLVRALRSVDASASRPLGFAIAAVEVSIGAVALVLPSAASAGAVAGLYAAFSMFLVRAMRSGGVVSSCGCFGRPDTPPTRAHLAMTAALTGVAAAVAVRPETLGGPPVTDVVVLGSGAVLAFLLWQVLDVLPTTTAASVRSARPAGAVAR